jgi:transposase
VLPEGYIYPKETRAVRDLLRRRMRLSQQHTANILAVPNLCALQRLVVPSLPNWRSLMPFDQPTDA